MNGPKYVLNKMIGHQDIFVWLVDFFILAVLVFRVLRFRPMRRKRPTRIKGLAGCVPVIDLDSCWVLVRHSMHYFAEHLTIEIMHTTKQIPVSWDLHIILRCSLCIVSGTPKNLSDMPIIIMPAAVAYSKYP